ncbi:MAG TPA: alpha/beta hydrolase [Kineosporiaceae bacterium]|nr:alpha/beta hydrolase [Kineosporiaceae bacterium]
MTTSVDAAETLIEGPWRHRFIAANGARFHVAEAGTGPLVMLLHGFPEFWWAWRHQLPALAAAGYRAVALDLRGYGASDKPPRGYDTITLAADVAGVIRALGETGAVIVGHDWGGWLAWSMPGLAPRETRAVAALSMAHPLTLRSALTWDNAQRRAWRPVLEFQLPIRPERQLTRGDRAVGLIERWSAPPSVGSGPDAFPDPKALEVYRRAMRVPFVAHSAMEYYRWALRSVPRRDGRRFTAAIQDRIAVPVLQLHGELDGFVLPATAVASHQRAGAGLSYGLIPGAGHFLPEEAPAQVTEALLNWLQTLP